MTATTPSPSSQTSATLDALSRAVRNALEKKRRLGQYAVVWRDGRPAFLGDAPDSDLPSATSLPCVPQTGQGLEQTQEDGGISDTTGSYHPDDK